MNITVWSYVDQLNISVLADDQTLEDTHEATRIRSNPQAEGFPQVAKRCRMFASPNSRVLSPMHVGDRSASSTRPTGSRLQHFHLADGQEVVLIDRTKDGVVTVAEAASNDVDAIDGL